MTCGCFTCWVLVFRRNAICFAVRGVTAVVLLDRSNLSICWSNCPIRRSERQDEKYSSSRNKKLTHNSPPSRGYWWQHPPVIPSRQTIYFAPGVLFLKDSGSRSLHPSKEKDYLSPVVPAV